MYIVPNTLKYKMFGYPRDDTDSRRVNASFPCIGAWIFTKMANGS